MPQYNVIHIEPLNQKRTKTGRLHETLAGWKLTPLLDLAVAAGQRRDQAGCEHAPARGKRQPGHAHPLIKECE